MPTSNNGYAYTIFLEEHLLLAGEIATMFNIVSKTNKPATNFVSAYLQEVVSSIPNYTQYYYTNKYGANCRVYGRDIYIPAMTHIARSLIGSGLTTITINNKNYNIKLGE